MKYFILSILFSTPLLAETLSVGSKKFTESVILGETLRLGLRVNGHEVTHRKELGGTAFLWNALRNGDVDIYPEYSGTIEEEILKKKFISLEDMKNALAQEGIGMSAPLGFNNTYAVGILEEKARRLGIEKISDLNRYQKLIFAWANEFMSRADGWPGLRKAYRLPHKNVRGIDHDVAYRALVNGDVDVIDLYSTDAEIPYYKIRALRDDKKFFPRYEAVILYRLEKESAVKDVLSLIEGKISEEEMSELNRRAKLEKLGATKVAADFLGNLVGEKIEVKKISVWDRILARSREHFRLVFVSLLLAILAGIPLGVIAAKIPTLGKGIIISVSAIQTIPALALLVLLIRPLGILGMSGIGDTPALIALFLYSLLPIVRNAHAGICHIPKGLQETALVLNLSRKLRLLKIELPLALPLILAGIKTSLVLNIGFATLGALVGAGGYGQSILTGIRLDDYGLILEGALPAAVLAIVAQGGFEILEKRIVSKGLRS